MNKFILPKPTLLDYLLPGLVNIKSKRFVSSGISVLIIVIGLMWSLFSNYSINSFVWTTPIIIFFYSLNYFVCKKQDKRKMFFSDQVTQFILYVNYLLYFAFFYLISISILLRLEKNNPVYTVGVLFWAGLATLGILMFFYHF